MVTVQLDGSSNSRPGPETEPTVASPRRWGLANVVVRVPKANGKGSNTGGGGRYISGDWPNVIVIGSKVKDV